MAKERGYDVVFYEQYDIKTPDYAPLMTKIKATNPDMLIVGAWAKEGILQVRAMKEIDFNPKVFFHAGGPPTPAFFKALGKDSNYAVGPATGARNTILRGPTSSRGVYQEVRDSPV